MIMRWAHFMSSGYSNVVAGCPASCKCLYDSFKPVSVLLW